MIYLFIIIVATGQLLHFLYCWKIFHSIKRRYKVIDARMANLGQWVVTGHQALSVRLEKLQEKPALEEKHISISQEETTALLLVALLSELSKKETPPHYYTALLEQLQQHNKDAGETHQPSEPVLRPVNRYAG